MADKQDLMWETLTSDTKNQWARAPVPGGWLVKFEGGSMPERSGLTFVPDPCHGWEITAKAG